MTFTPGTFTIQNYDRLARRQYTATVEGWVSNCGRFGIERHDGVSGVPEAIDDDETPDHYYVLTHIPTGFKFGTLDFMELADAELAAERFAALSVDWTSSDPKVITSGSDAKHLYRAMKESPLHRANWKGIPLGRDYANPHATV